MNGTVNEATQRMTIEATLKENYYSKAGTWKPLNTNLLTLQTTLQKRNTINEILFFITSYTCYIYTMTMSGNLKRKRCAYDTEFKLKVMSYADSCHNNMLMAHARKCETGEKLHST